MKIIGYEYQSCLLRILNSFYRKNVLLDSSTKLKNGN